MKNKHYYIIDNNTLRFSASFCIKKRLTIVVAILNEILGIARNPKF